MFAKYCRQKMLLSTLFILDIKNELLFIHFCKELIAWFQWLFLSFLKKSSLFFCFRGNICAKKGGEKNCWLLVLFWMYKSQ